MTTEANTTARLESDLHLVKRAQEGDAEAFASLFHAHKARIHSVCLRMTNNTAEAEDLTQDAFLQVFRKLATFRGDSALSTWLYRIAVNTVLMHFRKKALRQISLDEPYNQDAKVVRREYGSRDDRLTGCVDRIALARAIKELPDGYRTIFLLHEVEGYEHQEIFEVAIAQSQTPHSGTSGTRAAGKRGSAGASNAAPKRLRSMGTGGSAGRSTPETGVFSGFLAIHRIGRLRLGFRQEMDLAARLAVRRTEMRGLECTSEQS